MSLSSALSASSPSPAVKMLPRCYGCGDKVKDPNKQLLICSKCRANSYCSKECQKKHWRSRHQQTCPILSAARSNPLARTCQFWKTALKYEPMKDPIDLVKYRTPELLSRLPLYALVEGEEEMFQIGALGGCPQGVEFVTGFILKSLGLVEPLELSAAQGYINNVSIYESGTLLGYSRVNSQVIEMLCGNHALESLKKNKKMEHAVWKSKLVLYTVTVYNVFISVTGGYVPNTMASSQPLHSPLYNEPFETEDFQAKPQTKELK